MFTGLETNVVGFCIHYLPLEKSNLITGEDSESRMGCDWWKGNNRAFQIQNRRGILIKLKIL